MALYTKEYATKLIFNLASARQAEQAQRAIYDSGIVSPNQNTLATKLSPLAGILSFVFMRYPAVALAAGVISIVSGMIESEKDVLENLVYAGDRGLLSVIDFLAANPGYDSLEVNLPFIEYVTEGVRFVTGNGVVTRVHSGSGWIVL